MRAPRPLSIAALVGWDAPALVPQVAPTAVWGTYRIEPDGKLLQAVVAIEPLREITLPLAGVDHARLVVRALRAAGWRRTTR